MEVQMCPTFLDLHNPENVSVLLPRPFKKTFQG